MCNCDIECAKDFVKQNSDVDIKESEEDNEKFKNNFEKYPNTINWINELIDYHYPEKSLPTWVNVDKFYNHLKEELFNHIQSRIKDKEEYIWFFQYVIMLNSSHIKCEPIYEDDEELWPIIPSKVIIELNGEDYTTDE